MEVRAEDVPFMQFYSVVRRFMQLYSLAPYIPRAMASRDRADSRAQSLIF